MPQATRPVMLVILDGWGASDIAADNAVRLANTPNFDRLWQANPHAFLRTSGLDVGLPDGQMGNSEVGHLNIGAGRVVMQDLPRIGTAIADGSIAGLPALQAMITALRQTGGTCHLMGLMSSGGVHAHQDHAIALANILADADKAGQVFITDEDARPAGSAHPAAHLWDNGSDPAAELDRVLAVRAAALRNFSQAAIKPGTPMSQLEQTLVPIYLYHRYQMVAAAKLIGGLDYRYNLRGDGQPGPVIVDPAQQKKALAAVLKTLAPETLTLPESLLTLLPPAPPGSPRTIESFPSHTGLTFDPIAAAESAADLTLGTLLDPARASRLIEYHMRVPASPALRTMLEALSATVAERPEAGHSMSSEVERAVEFRALEAMLALAVNPAASTQARAITRSHIRDVMKAWTSASPLTDTAEAIHRAALIDRINEFERDPAKFVPSKPVEAPPGMPIGDQDEF